MPNPFAFLMLALWPVIAYAMFRRMPLERAVIWTILGGYMFLPPVAAFNLPMVPDMNKASIPNLSAFVMTTLILGHRLPILPASLAGKVLLALFVIAPFGTVLNNTELVTFGYGVPPLPAMRIYDSISAIANQTITLLPFFLARAFLATPKAMRELTVALMIAGLIYSLPILIEVRLSPQMNIWIYGFFQHSFEQMMRFGGFRPIVFMQHGIWVAFFVLMALVGALSMMRYEGPEARPKHLAAGLYLAVILVLCKTVGALALAVGMVPLVVLAPQRLQLRVAAVLAIIVVAYPILRGIGVVPTDELLSLAEMVDPDRAGSLRFRFENEAQILVQAQQKALFGWGGYNRNLVHDAITGHRITVADGRWIIVLGMSGWTGYIAEFGLLSLPILLLYRAFRAGAVVSIYAGPLALILAFNMVDMLPNATLIPFTWLLAGAIIGHAERAWQTSQETLALSRAAVHPLRRTIL